MTTRNIIAAASALLMIAATSSCSLLRGSKDNSLTPIGQVSGRPAKDPRHTVPAPPKTAGQRPDQATLCGGRWYIASVGTINIEAEEDAPYIDFESGTGRFYANDGCNIVNGDYLLRTDGTLLFSNVLSTMRYCADNEYNALIGSTLSGAQQLYVDTQRIGQDTYLYLRNDTDKVVMTLRRLNMEFLNGNWQITSVEGAAIDDEECTVFFDIPELRVHGNTGCNFFNGSIYIDPNRSNALDLSNMITTRRGCNKADQERRILVALESTASAIAGRHADTVLLLDSAGKEMMTLKRIPLPEMND